tara:strand:- start:11540 stop:11878 length:339 start_codon:yes stop_codon:yes gene_type:complete
MDLSLNTVQNYELGRRWPQPDVIDRLASILEVEPTRFFLSPRKGEMEDLARSLNDLLKGGSEDPKTMGIPQDILLLLSDFQDDEIVMGSIRGILNVAAKSRLSQASQKKKQA